MGSIGALNHYRSTCFEGSLFILTNDRIKYFLVSYKRPRRMDHAKRHISHFSLQIQHV